ncbi:TetR/AcrR family transcriptional regulator [Actinoplanes sp. NPDC051851]|uniref:TetR/AcrR family transcriptional regulator n=1 Tax=Actinoplanes sp. NPDC051851 TaxID=3154753 RepID=UPI003415D5A8
MSVRKQQAERTEAELKAAAIRVFERVGYLNAKITDITAEAGRATGSFYKHFASKEKLLEALLEDLLDVGDANALQAGHLDDFRDRAAVRYHVAAFWQTYRRHRPVLVALQQASIVDEEFARRSREMYEPDLHHIADHMRHLPGDPLMAASLFTVTLAALANGWLDANHPTPVRAVTSDEEAIEAITTFLHAGLGADLGAGLGAGPGASPSSPLSPISPSSPLSP